MSKMFVITLKEGTETSGFEGHAGRPGHRGGSVARSGVQRQLTAAEEAVRARGVMINRLSGNVLEDVTATGTANTGRLQRRQSRQPIGETLDIFAREVAEGETSVNDVANREIGRGRIFTAGDDVRIDESDRNALTIFLNSAVTAAEGDNVPSPAALQHPLSTPTVDAAVLGRMYDRIGHTTGPDSNDNLRNVMAIVNSPDATINDVNLAIATYNSDIYATGLIHDDEADQIRALYQDVRDNPARGAASYEALTRNQPFPVAAPAPGPTPYVTSDVLPVSYFRSNVQNLQAAYDGGDSTVRNVIAATQTQTLDRTAFNTLILQAGNVNPAIRSIQSDLMNAYDFYHRADTYTSYYNSSDEVRDSISRLQNEANGRSQTNAGANMADIINQASEHAIGGLTPTRQIYEERLNAWESDNGQLAPILRARASALWDQTQVTGTAVNPSQVQRVSTASSRPSRPAVPEMTTRDVFDTYINSAMSSVSTRTETIAYSALRAAVVNPESTIERVDATISDFDNTFPGTLSNDAKTAFKAAYALYHQDNALPAVVALPGNFTEFITKAKEHKLADELKASVHVKPLTIATAVATAELFGSAANIQTMNSVLRRATGNDSLDAVEFITDTYQDFEANGLKVKINRISASSTNEVNVYFNVVNTNGDNVGDGHRTLNDDGEVHNDLLTIDASVQGGGFGSAFYKHAEDRYLKAGFKKVTIQANISGGGYSWAAMGFENTDGNYEPGTKVPMRFIQALKIAYGGPLPYMPKHMWEIAAYVKPGYVLDANGEIPEEAKIGKTVLRGTNWYAEKYLNDNDLGFPIGQAYYSAHIGRPRRVRSRR